MEVDCSEAFWVFLGEEWDEYAEWRVNGGRVLDFRQADDVMLLNKFVEKWSAACIWLAW